MYQPTLGRFMSRDPLSENGVQVLYPFPDMTRLVKKGPFSGHPYSYCKCDPANLVDPAGLQGTAPTDVECCECHAAIYKAGNPQTLNSQSNKPPRRCTVRLRCAKDCGHGGALGWTDPPKPVPGSKIDYTIDVCISCKPRSGSADVVVRHELVHAQRFCNTPGLGPIKDCETCRKQEQVAYEESCKSLAMPGTPKYIKCVNCGVALSCSSFKNDKGGPCVQVGNCTYADVGIELKPYP